jgi:hypothetical protein
MFRCSRRLSSDKSDQLKTIEYDGHNIKIPSLDIAGLFEEFVGECCS